jgi:hypothetical protein
LRLNLRGLPAAGEGEQHGKHGGRVFVITGR